MYKYLFVSDIFRNVFWFWLEIQPNFFNIFQILYFSSVPTINK